MQLFTKPQSARFWILLTLIGLDGNPLVVYPEPGAGLMIVERNKWIGGADLRHVYGRRRL